jgi:hypothetical protein
MLGLMDDNELDYEQFAEEMQSIYQHPAFALALRPSECFMLLAQIQLALRHPENAGHSAMWARTLAQQLPNTCSVSPMIAAVAEAGMVRRRPAARGGPGRDVVRVAR